VNSIGFLIFCAGLCKKPNPAKFYIHIGSSIGEGALYWKNCLLLYSGLGDMKLANEYCQKLSDDYASFGMDPRVIEETFIAHSFNLYCLGTLMMGIERMKCFFFVYCPVLLIFFFLLFFIIGLLVGSHADAVGKLDDSQTYLSKVLKTSSAREDLQVQAYAMMVMMMMFYSYFLCLYLLLSIQFDLKKK
jgi:hypothetical protein